MPLALSTPRNLLPLALASVLAACPKPDDPEQDDGSGAPGDSETTGASAPGDTAEVAPTTGTTSGGEEPTSTATSENSTPGQDPSDSTTAADTSTGEPDFGHCPYAPDGVDVTLTRVEQGLATDLSARECGTVEQLSGLQVIAAGVDHLEVSVCADATCGACDPAVTLDLALALPDGLVGLPAQLAAGDCLQLDVEWSRAGADPAQCEVGGLAVVGLRRGHPEPVPKFMYRFTGAVPHTDPVGPFALTGIPHGPGAIACPCAGDCCLEPPGARRLRFIAALWNAEIESPPVDPGATIPLFLFGTPEGDDLYGDLSLARADVPGDCGAQPRYEWLLSVSPG
ncbi:hypothetical protein OV203_44740 [Nannocystis sp. ILAH1]|uniref:hypothetical protein n=1 Tax=unclassified Nannocystis TaxID=2627009 RepID=UPI00226F0D88|nr:MULTISPECIES: hypothetical protein [unclassified Nannocystis]MCY0994317.1 hypothetical protein [Nannocystis sp. ILAH1]MCY1064098.1 hypothetical protein [Nannocystis sp. RBIL2]